MTTALRIDALSAWHGAFRALSDVSLTLEAGRVLALVGANGAGKSTLLGLLTGRVPGWTGKVEVNGTALPPGDPRAASALGLALVPEGRLLFDSLSVEENLLIGGGGGRPGPWDVASVYRLFQILREKRHQRPSTMSGGQQQMLAIGRALMSNPSILLCDEISLGLSPPVVAEVYAALAEVRGQGTAMVIVDQDIARVCATADEVACLFKGRISHRGPARGTTPQSIREAYFGVAA